MSDGEDQAKRTESMSVKDKIKAFENKNKDNVVESLSKVSSASAHSTPSQQPSCLPPPSSVVQNTEEGTPVDPAMSDNPTGRFVIDDSSSIEDEEEDKEMQQEDEEDPEGEEDTHVSSLSSGSEKFEDAVQQLEDSESPLKLNFSDPTSCSRSDDSGSPDSPEAVWNPPSLSTTGQSPQIGPQGESSPQIGPQGESSPTFSSEAPQIKQTTPMHTEEPAPRTMHQNWVIEDNAQGDKPIETSNPVIQGQVVPGGTVYQNWDPETNSVPPPVPQRTYRGDAPPIPPKSYRGVPPTPQSSAIFGSDEDRSMYSLPGNTNQSRAAVLPNQSFPSMPPSNTSTEGQAPALPTKSPITELDPHSNPQSLPPKMEYPHFQNPSYPSMQGGMPAYGNPYMGLPGQQFPFPGTDTGMWGVPPDYQQNLPSMQQYIQMQYYAMMQYEQGMKSQMTAPQQTFSGPTPGGDTDSTVPSQGQGQRKPDPKEGGQTTSTPQMKSTPKPEQKPPKQEPKKPKKEPIPKVRKSVQGKEKAVPKSAPQEEEKTSRGFVCVNGLNPDTTEETLANFLEAKAKNDIEVKSVVYSEERGSAVVQFNSPVDVDELNKACKKKPLEGNYIENATIDPSRLIVVSAEGEVTEEILKKYFQNSAQSCGGDVQRVTRRSDGCFTVKFKREEDTMRVCEKLDHEVLHTPLVVTPLFFTDQGEIYDAIKHTVPLPNAFTVTDVDSHMQRFLQQSNQTMEQINAELEKKFAKVTVTEEIQVECLLSQKTPNARQHVKTWETDAKESFDFHVSEIIHKAEIEVTEDAWSEVEEYITTTHTHNPDSIITMYEKDTLKIVFVGEKMLVQEVHTQASNQNKAVESKLERKRQIKSEERECSASNIRLLERLGIFAEVNDIREDLEVDKDYQNGKILFRGVREDILEARLKIEEKLSQFEKWTIKEGLSRYQFLLLGTDPRKLDLQDEFQRQGLTVEVEFEDETIKVFVVDTSQKSSANKIIMNLTKESTIVLDETSLNVLSTEKWEKEMMTIQSEYYESAMISPANDAKITLTTTSDLHDDIKTRLENFIQENSIYTDIVDIEDEGVMKFIVKHCSKLLEQIQEKHQQHFLKVEIQNKQVMMSGTKEGISLARSDVRDMIRDINHEMKTYNQPGINKVLRTDQERLVEIEDSCRSIIMFTGPKQSPRSSVEEERPRRSRRDPFEAVPEPFSILHERETLSFAGTSRPVPTPRIQSGPYRCAESNIVIKLIRGDLAKQEGDVIVCSVGQTLHLNKGQSSRNLLKEGGQGLMAEIETKYPNGVKQGELANINGGNLRCQELYLGYLPHWSDGRSKVLVEFMNKCLKTAESSSYQTIVFPAMGTGQLGYPKDKVAEMMYQTVVDFDRKCAGTQVKEIKFVCYPGDLETCDAFEAEEKHRLNPHLPKAAVKAHAKGPYVTKNKTKISIVKAEIGKHSADVLVVACEKTLDLSNSGKAAKSLLENGGALLQEGARVKHPSGIANFGDFASIPGAGLKCQEVYLTALPKEEQTTQTTLCKFVANCMNQADQSGYGSVAFAAMGTGGMKYPASDVARNMYHEVKKYSDSNPNSSVKQVEFVLYPLDTSTIKAFEDYEKKLLHKISYSSGSGAYTTSNHGIVVTVKTASITKLKDTVIVLTAYPDLDLNKTQVTKAVLKEGGIAIQKDISSNYPNGIKEGDLAIVKGGNLPCKEIYIGTLPKYTSDPSTADKALKDLVMKCLTVATKKSHTSVSLPCLGTGYNGYPHPQAAAMLFEAVTEYDKSVSSTSVKNVNLVALNSDHKSIGAFQSEEKKFCSQQAPPSLGQSTLSPPGLSASLAMGASSMVRGAMSTASRIFKSDLPEEEDTSKVVARPGQKQNEVLIGQLTVSVSAGDLTEQKVDAIVNSTNLDLDFSQGGVSAALVNKCGKQLLTECADKKDEMKKKKMVVTSGCGLSNIKHIIHIECQTTINNWRGMVRKTLETANNTPCTTIAFPVVGTGKGFISFTPTAIGEMFLDSISEFMSQNRQCKVTLVKIVAFQEDMVTPLSKAMRDACGKSRNTGMLSTLSDMASNAGLLPQRGVASSAAKEDPSVTLWIYGDTRSDRDNTIKEIQTFIKSQSTKAEISDQLLPNLKPSEKTKIERVKEQHDVKMSLELQRGMVTVEGLFDEVANAKDKIHQLLRDFQKERWLDEEATLVATTVQWSVMVKDQTTGLDKLEPYPERQNMYLENAYKRKENQVTLRAEDGDIIVDLTTMKEYPADDPSQQDNVVRKEKVTGNMIELPAHWTPMQDTENIKVVTLLPTSTEYTDIEKKFLNSVKTGIYNIGKAPNPANNPVGQFNNVKISKIERIQNPSLYQQYAAKRANIEKDVDQNTTLEQDLWHGAPPTAIVSINYYGFNRSYCGDNAGEPWYGRGVYFANDASYSARNWVSAPDPSMKKKMYQAKVVTGHVCQGQKGMRYLPQRMPMVNYDCAVDNTNKPLEFVIFNDTQAYPEYCIEFTI